MICASMMGLSCLKLSTDGNCNKYCCKYSCIASQAELSIKYMESDRRVICCSINGFVYFCVKYVVAYRSMYSCHCLPIVFVAWLTIQGAVEKRVPDLSLESVHGLFFF